jgi:hypothetical protein
LPTSNVKPTWKAFVLLLLFQKRSSIFDLETKFWIETKRFLSVLEKFGPKAFVLVDFQIFFGTSKSFVLSLKNPGAIWNVLVPFWYSFFLNTKVQFWFLWSIGVWKRFDPIKNKLGFILVLFLNFKKTPKRSDSILNN